MAILPEHIWNFLHELEGRLRKAIKGVGRMDHELWRRFTNDARDEEAFGVVDGDLVEQFFVSSNQFWPFFDDFSRISALRNKRTSFLRCKLKRPMVQKCRQAMSASFDLWTTWPGYTE